ncbi:MAG: VOC family protein [Steroidobacteraceae bacterium]|jgi:catechol 2,3-dioxygenase-like lactoylglutathione lyase family enzyme|nr:VOC family protein [Steroidobacteraceae bacterium]
MTIRNPRRALVALAASLLAPAFAQAPPATIAPPVQTDPASVVPGSKAVARRVTLVVADLERSLRFYEALGFKADRRVEVTDAESLEVFGLPAGSRLTFARLVGDNTLSTGRIDGGTIGLAQVHSPKLERLRDRTRGETLVGMPILVMTTDGVEAIHARLRALGAEVLKPPQTTPAGWSTLILRDPDGTRMEITQPPPSAILPAKSMR